MSALTLSCTGNENELSKLAQSPADLSESIVVFPSLVDFGNVDPVQGKQLANVTITNRSTGNVFVQIPTEVTATLVGLKLNDSTGISVQSTNCPQGSSALAAAQTCLVTLALDPSAAGDSLRFREFELGFGLNANEYSSKKKLAGAAIVKIPVAKDSASTDATTTENAASTSASLTKQLFAIVGDNGTVAPSGTQVIKVKAFDSAKDAAIASEAIKFQLLPAESGTLTGNSGTGTTLTQTTDVDGVATVSFNAGATPGPVVIIATSSFGGTSFSLSIVAPSSSTGVVTKQLYAIAGNLATVATSGTKTVSVKAFDSLTDAPVANESVKFQLFPSSAGTLTGASGTSSSVTNVTDANGLATVTFNAGSITGAVVVVATSSFGGTTINLSVESPTAASAAVTRQIYPIAGNNTTVATSGTKTLSVKTYDSVADAAIANEVIKFQLFPSTAGTLSGSSGTSAVVTESTNASGVASITLSAGSNTGSAVVIATSSFGGTSFGITIGPAGVGSQVLKTSGDGSAINTSASQVLELLALDSENAPIAGNSVTFAISPGGIGTLTGGMQVATTTTNASGRASVTYYSGTVSGSNNVVASVQGVGSASFTINVASGGGGSGTPPLTFSPTSLSPAATTWANVAVGSSALKSISISNTTSGNLYINSLSSTTSHFVVDSDNCPKTPNTFASSASCTVNLRFTPTADGTVDRFLFVNWSASSDGSSPQISSAALQGSGPAAISDFAGIDSISSVSHDRMTLNWTSYAGNHGYSVYRIVSGNEVFFDNANNTATSYTATGLTANTTYVWRVHAFNSANVADANANNQSATTTAVPVAPVLTTVSTSAYLMGAAAKNNALVAAQQTLTVDVNNVLSGSPGNDTGMSYTCTVGRTITGACGTGSKLSCSASTLPGIVSFNAGTGALSWTPSYAAQGTWEFCLSGSDSGGSDTEVFALNVINPTLGKGVGDVAPYLSADWRAAFSNYEAVASGATWYDIYGSNNGSIAGSGTWAGSNTNSYSSPLRMNFTGNTEIDFNATLTGNVGFLIDGWFNNSNSSFATTNNSVVVLQNDSSTNDHGFTLKQQVDPVTARKQLRYLYDQDYRSMVIADGATIYYRFDDASGTVLTDEIGGTGGGNNGTLDTTNYTFRTAGALIHSPNNYAIARKTSTAVNGVFPDTNGFKPTNNFTYEFWYKIPVGGTTDTDIFAFGSGSGLAFWLTSNTISVYETYGTCAASSSAPYLTHNASAAITAAGHNQDSAWHHVVVTHAAVGSPATNVRTVYLDGVVSRIDSCGTSATPITWTGNYRGFGTYRSTVGMALDEVAIYGSTVLTATQVRSHYLAAIGAVDREGIFPGNAQMQDGPIGYWRLGESSGTRATDSSGFGNHGIYQGTPTLAQTGAGVRLNIAANTSQAPGSGDDDRAVVIPTKADAILIPGSPSLVFDQQLTVEGWVYLSNLGSVNSCVTLASQDNVWSLQYSAANWIGAVRFLLGTHSACGSTLGSPNYTGPHGQGSVTGWYHIAAVYDGSQPLASQRLTVYFNGDAYQSTTGTTVTSLLSYYSNTLKNMYIGSDSGGVNSNPTSNLKFDEFAVYNRALTHDQIMARVYDASYRYCDIPVTTTYSVPSITQPYDHVAALFNGSSTEVNLNGRRVCRLRTGTKVDFTANSDDFKAGATSGGFVGNITELRAYAGPSSVATSAQAVKNFLVGSDMHRPQAVGPLQFTGLEVALEAGSSRDGVRPNDVTGSCAGANLYWRSFGASPTTGQLFNFTNCSSTNVAWKGSGVPASDPYRVVFDGSLTHFVDLGSSIFFSGASSGSVCTWFKTSSLPVGTGIVSKAKSSAAIFLGGDDSSANYLQFNINGTSNKAVSTPAVNDNNWHYACGTYNGSHIRLYVDGAFQSKSAYSTGINSTTDHLAIGANVAAGRASINGAFTGSIGAVHLYSSAISSDDIYNNCVAQASLYTTTAPATFCTHSANNP